MSNAPSSRPGPKVRTVLQLFYALPVLFVLGVFGFIVWQRATHQKPPEHKMSANPFASVSIGPLKANLFTEGNQLRAAGNDLFIEFRDAQNKLIDVGDVHLMLELKMPGMVRHSIGKVMRTGTPGQYRTTLEPDLAGDWVGRLDYSGTNGTVETNFYVNVAK